MGFIGAMENAAQFADIKPMQPHLFADAKLFCDRFDQMRHIRALLLEAGIKQPSILEIGVGFGWFSKFLIHTFEPRLFAGIDVFEFHTYDSLWGVDVRTELKGRDHVDYYRDELTAIYEGELLVEKGPSASTIERFADDSFDVIYIDAGHLYQDVIVDAWASLRKVRPGGYIIFNDYTMTDHQSRVDYGVVKAANEIIHESGRMKVIGFALDPQMFCDLAVRVD